MVILCIMKVIKRYANRRLYDSDTSRTITLEEVAEFVRNGEEIKVIDNISSKDITSKILGQTFLKTHEPKDNEPLINFILTAMIRESGSGFVNVVKKLVFAGIGVAQMSKDNRDSVLDTLVKLEDVSDQQKEMFQNLAAEGQKQADQLWESFKHGMNDVTEKIQSAVRASIDPLERSKKIEGLSAQVDELAKNIKGFLAQKNEKPSKKTDEEKADKLEGKKNSKKTK